MMRIGRRLFSFRFVSTCLAAISLLACGDDGGDKGDAADGDTTGDTAPLEVAGTEEDTPHLETSQDTAVEDTASEDTASQDTAPADADDTDDADEPDTSACEPFPEPVILKCGQAHVQVSRWTDLIDNACADYFTRGEERYDTIEALAAAEGCDASCVYIASQAVDFIRCDGQGRSGYETFRAEGEGCLDGVYRTADGIFTDLCLWSVYQCYCDGG